MSRLLKEPFFHFLLMGGLLFAAYGWLNRGSEQQARVVRISAADVNWLKETWSRQWQRQPDQQELRDLVTGYLREVVLAREAVELGLDDNDTVVRRRLAQKMEFLLQDTVRLVEPGEDELRRLYDANPTQYLTPARVTFNQIFFKSETAASQALQDVAAHNSRQLGDRSLLEEEHHESDQQTVSSLFGNEFAEKVFELEPDEWHGPIASAYGYHLIRVSQRQSGQLRPFPEVRTQVLEEWHRSQQVRANELFYAELVKKYDVVVEESVKPYIEPIVSIAEVKR